MIYLYVKTHMKVHDEDFETEILGEFSDVAECEDFALDFSAKNSIVESDHWANLRNENGQDGAPKGNVVSKETRNKISKSLIGKPSPKSKYEMKESKQNRSERSKKAVSGTVWINDGIISKRSKTVPDGWTLGRLGDIGSSDLGKRNTNGNNTRGRKIYNNGVRHAYFVPGFEPDGWASGKMQGYQGGTGALRKGKTYGKN